MSTPVMLSNTATQTKSYYNLSILQKPSFSTLDIFVQTFLAKRGNIMFSGPFLYSVKSWLGCAGFPTKKVPSLYFRKIRNTNSYAGFSCHPVINLYRGACL